jgi:hypothetical protein
MSVMGAQLTANIAGNKGGGIYNQESQYDKAEFRVSVFDANLPQNCRDQNSSDDQLPVNAVPPIDSKGQNSFSDNSCDNPDETTDWHVADPKLGPLQYNGGPPGFLTRMPAIDSPLVDVIDPALYVVDPDIGDKDIRGRPRQADGNGNGLFFIDIGPVERDDSQPEFVSIPSAPGPINIGSVTQNTTITKTNAGDLQRRRRESDPEQCLDRWLKSCRIRPGLGHPDADLGGKQRDSIADLHADRGRSPQRHPEHEHQRPDSSVAQFQPVLRRVAQPHQRRLWIHPGIAGTAQRRDHRRQAGGDDDYRA